jgi:hypothetical protein
MLERLASDYVFFMRTRLRRYVLGQCRFAHRAISEIYLPGRIPRASLAQRIHNPNR